MRTIFASALVWVCLLPAVTLAQPSANKEDAIVESAGVVLTEIMSVHVKSIPESMLADAEGVAIIPGVVKLGFVVGGRHGRGVVLVRDKNRAWTPPKFISLTGGSVGWQAGVQSTDVILVFKTRKSVEGLLDGKFTIGADASVAAGPVGRKAGAATDGKLKAEIYSYSRSRGLFAGVSLDGSVLRVDHRANNVYYGPPPPPGAPQDDPIPQSAVKLMGTVAKYADSKGHAVIVEEVEQAPPPRPDSLRQHLLVAFERLNALLNDQWRKYLVLPREVYTGAPEPSVQSLQESLQRYDAVVADPRYAALSSRPEFQATHRLLRAYLETRKKQPSVGLQLPPPPGNNPGVRR